MAVVGRTEDVEVVRSLIDTSKDIVKQMKEERLKKTIDPSRAVSNPDNWKDDDKTDE